MSYSSNKCIKDFSIVAGLVILSIVLYLQSFDVPLLLWDDDMYITKSAYIPKGEEEIPWKLIFSRPYFANFHPVTTATWVLDAQGSWDALNQQFSTFRFHLSHLIYYAVGAALLFLILMQMMKDRLLALCVTALWVAHPTHVESVVWISARKDLVSWVFFLAGFYSYLRYREAPQRRSWPMLIFFFYVLAVLSKPIAVILPVVLFTYDFCMNEGDVKSRLSRFFIDSAIFLVVGLLPLLALKPFLIKDLEGAGPPLLMMFYVIFFLGLLWLYRMAPSAQPERESILGRLQFGVPFYIIFCLTGLITVWSQQDVGAITDRAGIFEDIDIMARSFWAYFHKAFLPLETSPRYLTIEYAKWSIKGLCGIGLLIMTLGLALFLSSIKDQPRHGDDTLEHKPAYMRLAAFGLFFFLIALLPVSNIIPISTKLADRYLFYPTAGFLLSLLIFINLIFRQHRKIVLLTAGLLFCFYSAQTYSWQRIWTGDKFFEKPLKNPQTQVTHSLWLQALQENPKHYIALANIGDIYNGQGKLDQAKEYFDKAEETLAGLNRTSSLNKQISYPALYFSQGLNYYLRSGDEIRHILSEQTNRNTPIQARSLKKTQRLLMEAERYLVSASNTIAYSLEQSKIYYYLGNITASQIWLYFRQEEIDPLKVNRLQKKAVAMFERSLQLNPMEVAIYTDYGRFWLDLGLEYEKRQNLKEALNAYVKASKVYMRGHSGGLPGNPLNIFHEGNSYLKIASLQEGEARQKAAAKSKNLYREALAKGANSPNLNAPEVLKNLCILHLYIEQDIGAAGKVLEQLKLLVGADHSLVKNLDAAIRQSEKRQVSRE